MAAFFLACTIASQSDSFTVLGAETWDLLLLAGMLDEILLFAILNSLILLICCCFSWAVLRAWKRLLSLLLERPRGRGAKELPVDMLAFGGWRVTRTLERCVLEKRLALTDGNGVHHHSQDKQRTALVPTPLSGYCG